MIDVDDTSRCPRAKACASCHRPGGSLEIAAITTDVGVLCLTVCDGCIAANKLPMFDTRTAAELVVEHCGHLGCRVEEMAAALKARTKERAR